MPTNAGGGGKNKGGGGGSNKSKGGGGQKGPTRLPKSPKSTSSSGRKLINLGSKARKAAKANRDAAPAQGHMVLPGRSGGAKGGGGEGSRNPADAELGTELEDVDWSKVEGWSKIRYDPNRLIFGAQEEGFIELEEIDMQDVFRGGSAAGAPKAVVEEGTDLSGDGGDDDFKDFDFGGINEDDGGVGEDGGAAAKRRKKEPATKDAIAAKVTAKATTTTKAKVKANASAKAKVAAAVEDDGDEDADDAGDAGDPYESVSSAPPALGPSVVQKSKDVSTVHDDAEGRYQDTDASVVVVDVQGRR